MNTSQVTALHWATCNGQDKLVRLLLEKGADITAKDSDGKTALDWADASKHEEVVRILTLLPNSRYSPSSNPDGKNDANLKRMKLAIRNMMTNLWSVGQMMWHIIMSELRF